MKYRILVILTTVLFAFGAKEAKAQGIVVKTNLAGWAALAPNIGVDLCVNEYSSIEAIFYKSAIDSWIKDVNFTALQLGYRYWFDRTPMNSFFCGVTATPARYEIKINESLRKGDAIPFGVNIGYCHPLSDRWNIEVSYGIGATYLYEESSTSTVISDVSNVVVTSTTSRHNIAFTPTNIGINISYIIK